MQVNAKEQNGSAFAVTRVVCTTDVACERLMHIAQSLESVEGVFQARVGRRGRLRIRYDASCIGFWDIERLLDEGGITLSRSAWWRFKSAWYRFLDQNAHANAISKGGACCSNPVDILAKRHRD